MTGKIDNMSIDELRAEVTRLRAIVAEDHGDDYWGIEGYDFEHCEWFGIPDDDLPDDCPLNAELCGDCTRYEDCDTEIERKKRERR